ncbi:hypothetical protein AYO44_18585 [Planctomycetaceae bacterium SCGC AG-212-F19]|nr:hypothetical protein AYO44_18585 [Planctomycetaceae bacterium SCGC AG-212-F19]
MHRFVLRFLLLAGLMVGLCSTTPIGAQSKKKIGGPVVDLDGMKSQVYEHWKPQKAESPNLYSFLLPKDLKTDADAAMLSIYPVTGSSDDVTAGWKGQFTPPKGVKNIDDVIRTEKFKVGSTNVVKFLIQGDYTDGAKKAPDSRMLAFVVEGKDKKYAIRMVGPFKTTGLHMQDLETWVKAFK